MKKRKAVALAAWGVLMLAVLSGCGGSGTPPTVPSTPPPTPAASTAVIHDDSFPVGSKVVVPDTFTTSSAGTLTVTVDWTFASNDVDIFVARGSEPCTLQTFNDRSCGFLASDESTTMKPEKLTMSNLAAGTYTLYVANFGSTDESVACHITLTGGGAGASITAVPLSHAAPSKGGVVRMLAAPDSN
jgi:hypothetical protein